MNSVSLCSSCLLEWRKCIVVQLLTLLDAASHAVVLQPLLSS